MKITELPNEKYRYEMHYIDDETGKRKKAIMTHEQNSEAIKKELFFKVHNMIKRS